MESCDNVLDLAYTVEFSTLGIESCEQFQQKTKVILEKELLRKKRQNVRQLQYLIIKRTVEQWNSTTMHVQAKLSARESQNIAFTRQ